MSAEDDRYYYEQEAALEAFLEGSLQNISADNMRAYLGTYGDAIEERVRECLRQSKELFNLNYYAQSLTGSLTAIECAEAMLNQIVYPIAIKLGFTLEATGKWHKILRENDHGAYESSYIAKNPFQKQ
jgi:hypothetical protein